MNLGHLFSIIFLHKNFIKKNYNFFLHNKMYLFYVRRGYPTLEEGIIYILLLSLFLLLLLLLSFKLIGRFCVSGSS